MFNLSGFWGGASRTSADRTADSLDAFASERAPAPAPPVTLGRLAPGSTIYLAAGLLVLVAAIVGLDWWVSARPAPTLAVVTIASDPAGALVLMQGIPKGVTPVVLSIPPGDHVFDVVYEGRREPLRLSARPDTTVVHHVRFERPAPDVLPVPPAAPPAAVVRTPAPAAPAGPVGGWLTVASPIPLQILEHGVVVGTSTARRVMLPAGTRRLRFVNEGLGYVAERTVRLGPGQTTSVSLEVPRAPLHINAAPWAEVWVDGVRVGETPIGNYMVTLGNHEVVFRHPTFGERRRAAVVSLKGPARVSVDLRKPQ